MWNSLYKRRPLNIVLIYHYEHKKTNYRKFSESWSIADQLKEAKIQEIESMESKAFKFEGKNAIFKAAKAWYAAFVLKKKLIKKEPGVYNKAVSYFLKIMIKWTEIVVIKEKSKQVLEMIQLIDKFTTMPIGFPAKKKYRAKCLLLQAVYNYRIKKPYVGFEFIKRGLPLESDMVNYFLLAAYGCSCTMDYKAAIMFNEQSLDLITKKIKQKQIKSEKDFANCHIAMFTALYNIACDYGNLYNRFEAEEYTIKAMELAKDYLTENHFLFNKISVLYQELFGEVQSANKLEFQESYAFFPGFETEKPADELPTIDKDKDDKFVELRMETPIPSRREKRNKSLNSSRGYNNSRKNAARSGRMPHKKQSPYTAQLHRDRCASLPKGAGSEKPSRKLSRPSTNRKDEEFEEQTPEASFSKPGKSEDLMVTL